MTTTAVKHYVSVGQTFMHEAPFSEVCMHMRIAGTYKTMRRVSEHAVQIYDIDGRLMGGAVTTGEAGLLCDDQGVYYVMYRKSK